MKITRFLLPLLSIFAILSSPAKGQIPVTDVASITQAVTDYVQQLLMKAIEQKTSDYTSDILDVEEIIQEATGTVSGRRQYTQNMQRTLNRIPNRMNGTFGGILGFDGEKAWSKNNPTANSMTSMLDTMMGRSQRSAMQANQSMENGNFDSNKAAGALSQMTATQSLLSESEKAATLKELQEQASGAINQQEGQAVATQAALEGVASQNEANTIMATDSLSRQEAMDEKRRNMRERAAGAAAANMETYPIGQ